MLRWVSNFGIFDLSLSSQELDLENEGLLGDVEVEKEIQRLHHKLSQSIASLEAKRALPEDTTKEEESLRSAIASTRKQLLSLIDQRAADQSSEFIKFRDKLAWTLGLCNIILTNIVMHKYPMNMDVFYTVKFFIYLPLRFLLFKSRNWHYFLYDFCYFANTLVIIYLNFMPDSAYLLLLCTAFANGPLAWAIPLWRNSLVLHSLDHTTSVFIHLTPMLTLYSLYWNDPEEKMIKLAQEFTLGQIVLASLPPYLAWQVFYLVGVEFLSKKKVEEHNYATSFKTFRAKKKGLVANILQSVDPIFQLPLFVANQLVYTVITIFPVYLYFNYFLLHTAFVYAMVIVSIWNGASFYIDVFSSRYAALLASAKHETENKSTKPGERIPSDEHCVLL